MGEGGARDREVTWVVSGGGCREGRPLLGAGDGGSWIGHVVYEVTNKRGKGQRQKREREREKTQTSFRPLVLFRSCQRAA